MSFSVVESRSKEGITYRPVIKLIDQDWAKVDFTSLDGSSPPSYWKGEKVKVLYQARSPQNAAINAFSRSGGLSLIAGGLGSIFLVISVAIIVKVTLSISPLSILLAKKRLYRQAFGACPADLPIGVIKASQASGFVRPAAYRS